MTRLFLLILFFIVPQLEANPFFSALVRLRESPYGYCFFNPSISSAEWDACQEIRVEEERFFHYFGNLENVEKEAVEFLCSVGENTYADAEAIAAMVGRIASRIFEASGKEYGWVHLRASPPIPDYDIPRWHFDGYFYPPVPEPFMFKFVMTLKGPQTLFYPIPEELRAEARAHMRDRKYMDELFEKELIEAANPGEGAYLIGGSKKTSAYHSEPPIHEDRLFFSVVPCTQEQLTILRKKILSTYPKKLSMEY